MQRACTCRSSQCTYLLPRSAEFAIHEALHFRVGRSARSNELAMLVSDLLIHIPAPVYRETHVQEHHVYTKVTDPDLGVSYCTSSMLPAFPRELAS